MLRRRAGRRRTANQINEHHERAEHTNDEGARSSTAPMAWQMFLLFSENYSMRPLQFNRLTSTTTTTMFRSRGSDRMKTGMAAGCSLGLLGCCYVIHVRGPPRRRCRMHEN